MPTLTNPYQPSATTPVPIANASADDQSIYFQGSMTMEEGRQADQLIRGKKLAAKTDRKTLMHGMLVTLGLFLWISWEAITYDEIDLLLAPAAQVFAVATAFAGVWWYQQKRDESHAKLKADQKGVFQRMGGRVRATGIEYLVDDFPIRFDWDDFVGCRVADDVALLYLDFPKEMNVLAASYFASTDQWLQAKATIGSNLPRIGPTALRAPRARSARMNHIVVGMQKLNQQDWQPAIDEFDAALQIDPGSSQAIRGRLIALTATDDLEAATLAAEHSIAHGVNDRTTRLVRARVLIATERYDDALSDLNWLVGHGPEDFEPLRDRGLVNLMLGRHEASVADLSRALDLSADDALTLNNRGAALIELGRLDEAVADLERALEIDPTFERPKYHLERARKLS